MVVVVDRVGDQLVGPGNRGLESDLVEGQPGEGTLRVEWRTGDGPWQAQPATPVGPARYEATIPGEAVTGPLSARWVLAVGGEETESDVATIAIVARPARPNLLYSADELAAMKAKIEQFDWARTAWDNTLRSADGWLEQPIEPRRNVAAHGRRAHRVDRPR